MRMNVGPRLRIGTRPSVDQSWEARSEKSGLHATSLMDPKKAQGCAQRARQMTGALQGGMHAESKS
jgi:hypothetical protein